MSKITARFTVLFCAIYFVYVIYNAWKGISVFDDTYKILLELCLFLQVNNDKHFHCRYMRHLALAVLLTDLISIVDTKFDIIPSSEAFLAIISLIWIFGIISPVYLAVKHFMKVNNIKKRYGKSKD